MKHKLTIFDRFFHAFREIALYHHDSLEFRAKIYAVMVVANSDYGEERNNKKRNDNHDICEFDKLEIISEEIYPKDIRRQNALLLTIREYVNKIREPNGLGLDELIFNIEKKLKRKPRFVEKINIEHLKNLAKCPTDEESDIYQKRIISFLERLKSSYSNDKNKQVVDQKSEIHNEDIDLDEVVKNI